MANYARGIVEEALQSLGASGSSRFWDSKGTTKVEHGEMFTSAFRLVNSYSNLPP